MGLLKDCGIDDNDIVISGMSGRFPISRNISEFEENLMSKKNLVTPKNDPAWLNDTSVIPNYIGQLYDINKFDNAFFGFPMKLAEAHSPLVRIGMELAYEAITDAGLNIDEVRGKNGAVVMTSHIVDTEHLSANVRNGILGHSRTMLANRISYWINLVGPSYNIFSMDAGGVEVLSKAYNLIKSGECDFAIVGSGNTIFVPHVSHSYKLLNCLSEDGKCRSFDAQGSGYARSESFTVFMVQKAKHAKRIYASIVDCDICMFGERDSPFVKPIYIQYADLLREFYKRCGVDPNSVTYLEMEGNALKHIEEEEMKALENVFLKDRKSPLLIGSVKSNMGHSDSGANHCSIVKMLIAMQRGFIPPNINFNEPASYIAKHISEGKLQVVTEKTVFDGEYMSLSTVDMTGKAGHILLRKLNKEKLKDTHKDKLPRLVLLTSRTEEGVNNWLKEVEDMPIDTEYIGLLHERFHINSSSNFFKGYTIVPQDQKKLKAIQYYNGTKRPIWFVFSGMGSQWIGMGEDLMKLPVCAAAIENCHAVLAEKGLDLKHIITTKDPTIFENILHCFVGIAAIQIALVDVLTAVGIKPDGIIGHSVGELGCAYSDGCFTQEQMILAAYYRGLASIQTELIPGSMAAVGLGYKEVVGMLPSTIDVACHNSATSSTLSGPSEEVKNFVEELKGKKIFAHAVNVANIAYHSRYIKPAAPALLEFLKMVIPEPKKRSSLWICSSVPEERWFTPLAQYASAEYFTNNLLSPVLFEEASKYVPKNAIAIEVAPHGLLQAILRRSFDTDCINIPLTNRTAEDNLKFMLSALGNLYLAGVSLKVQALYTPIEFPVSRGTKSIAQNIIWEHSIQINEVYFHLEKLELPDEEVMLSLSNENERAYVHHILNGHIFLPAFAYLKIIWDILAELHLTSSDKLSVVFENVRFFQQLKLPERGSVKIQTLIQQGSGYFEMSSDGVVIVNGRVSVLESGAEEPVAQVSAVLNETTLTEDDIYTEFDRRGHQYGKPFQGIKQATLGRKGSIARVEWFNNWVTFIDSLFQLMILQTEEESDCVQQPFTIQKLIIDPKMYKKPVKEFEAVYYAPTRTLSCAGIKIHNMQTVKILNEPNEFMLSKVKFLSYTLNNSMGVKEFAAMSIQIILENWCNSANITVVHVTGGEVEDDTTSIIKTTFENDTNITLIEVPAAGSKMIKTEEKASYALVIAMNVDILHECLALLGHENCFLMLRLSQNQVLNMNHNLLVVAELTIDKEKLIVLKKAYVPDKRKCSVLKLSGEVSNWLNEIKSVAPSERLYAVRETNEAELSITPYFVKKLLNMSLLEHVRFIFVADENAPSFSLDKDLYSKQLHQDLHINTFMNGTWGSFHPVAIKRENITEHQLYLNSILSKDISYLALNLQDLSVNVENGNKSQWEKEGLQGLGPLDFSGYSVAGQRVMGVAKIDSKLIKIVPEEHFIWEVPRSWSLEDAATVPLAYALAYYALVLRAQIKPKQVVLVHSGGSTMGQACISLALHYNCTVFTTVCNEKQNKYLREKFPQISDKNICDTDDTKFQVKVFEATKGEGVDIVVNTLIGSNLKASWKCLGLNGHFIQLGKTPLINNESIDMCQFLQCVHFHGVVPGNLLSISTKWKESIHSAIQEGIASEVVQPLKRFTFSKKQLNQALSILADQRHVNKVLIAVGNEHITDNKAFKCDPDSSYLITGVNPRQCMDVAEWLIRRGALHMVVATSCKNISNEILRRIEILHSYFQSEVHLIDVTTVPTLQRARELFREVAVLTNAKLAALFVLPLESSGQDSSPCITSIYNLDCAAREVTSLKHFVCLLMENSWTICEKRHRSGLPALSVQWSNSKTDGFRLLPSLVVLDQLLTKDGHDPVVIVTQKLQSKQKKETMTASVTGLLPTSIEELVQFGKEVATANSKSWLVELSSKSPGLAHTKNMPMVIFVPGTQNNPQKFLKPLVNKIINPAVCVKLPSGEISLEEAAVKIAEEIKELQRGYTYHLVGISTGGLLTLQIAHCLEESGADVDVILIDGAPETIQLMAKQLGEGITTQVNLISMLLKLNVDVYSQLSQQPTLPAKIKYAMTQLSHDVQTKGLQIEAGISSIYNILNSLIQHKPTEKLLKGKVWLIRPAGTKADDHCGLSQFFKQTVTVHTVKAAHHEMFTCDETVEIINENAY